jgi:hypothetical protein
MVDQFHYRIPDRFKEDNQAVAFFRAIILWMDEMSEAGGFIEATETSNETVITQGEKLDLITVDESVNLNQIDTSTNINTAKRLSQQAVWDSFSNTGSTTLRTLVADAASIVISNPVTQAQGETLRDAILATNNYLSTLINDSQT